MVREGLSDKRTFVQRGHTLRRLGEEHSRPGNSKCKGPEVGGKGSASLRASWRLLPMEQGESGRRGQRQKGPQALEDSGLSSESLVL